MNKLFSYVSFLKENVQAAKALLKKIGKSTDEPAYKKIIELLGNATGYMHWFTKQHFLNGAALEDIEQIINIIKSEKAIIDKFKTPIIELESCEKFWDEYLAVSRNVEAKAAYNEFPAKQKRFLDLTNPKHLQMLKDLWTDTDKRNFLSKLAFYTDKETLLQNLYNHLYLKTSKVTEELLDSLKKYRVNIVYVDLEKEIIITTVNYSQIVKFCSDTSWCIMRSESWFNSYLNYDYFSKQFVIFLPGRTDLLRKIGVTHGATKMSAAHQLDDSRVTSERIFQILKEYGVDNKKIFFEEVKNKIERKNIDMDSHPVEALLNIGLTKKEILQNKEIFKKSYGIEPTRKDLSFFSKEEIEEWNILDRAELSLVDLIFMDSKKIVEKKLWRRVSNFEFKNFALLDPIDYDTAREIAAEVKFKKDKDAQTFLKKQRKNILKDITPYRYHIYLPLIRTKEEFSKNFEIDFDKVIRLLREISESQKLLTSSQNHNVFTLRLISQYYKLDKKNLQALVNNIFSIITILKKDPEIIPKNELKNNQSEITKILEEIMLELLLDEENTIYDPEVMEEIKSIVSSNLYKEIFSKMQKRVHRIQDPFALSRLVYKDINSRFGREPESANARKGLLDIEVLNFWEFDSTISLDKWSFVFGSHNSNTLLQQAKIHEYLKGLGYDISSKEYFEFICRTGTRNVNELPFWLFCIQNNIGGSEAIDVLLDLTEKGDVRMDSEEFEKIKQVLSDEKANKLLENYLYDFARKQTIRGSIFSPEWLSSSFPVLKRNKDKVEKYNLTTTLIISLAKLEQEKELMELGISIKKLSEFEILALKITQTDKWDREDLNQNIRKLIWNYLKKNLQLEEQDKAEAEKHLLVCRWIFDKKNIEKWLDKAKAVKNNEEYYARSYEDGVKKRTNRFYAISELIKYLALEDPKKITEVLSKFTFNKFEKKWAYNWCKFERSRIKNELARKLISSIWEGEEKMESVIKSFDYFSY